MENLLAAVQSNSIVWGMGDGIQFIYGSCWCCYSTCPVMHVWSFFYWPKCRMGIDVFEDSSNVQENLLKQLKYFPDQESNLLQDLLFIVCFSFVSCWPLFACGDDRRYIGFWWTLAKKFAQGGTESSVILGKYRKVEWNLVRHLSCLNLSCFPQRAMSCIIPLLDSHLQIQLHIRRTITFVLLVISKIGRSVSVHKALAVFEILCRYKTRNY